MGRTQFLFPGDVSTDSIGNVYVADTNNNLIRKITPDGVVSTLAGHTLRLGFYNGQGTTASFNRPTSIITGDDDHLFVADRDFGRIRRITPSGLVSTYAGSGYGGHHDGPGSTARFSAPSAIYLSPDGSMYVSNTDKPAIRIITIAPPTPPTTITSIEKTIGQGVLHQNQLFTEGLPQPILKISSPLLPPGLTLSPQGTLQGTPTTRGLFEGEIIAENYKGTSTRRFSILVIDEDYLGWASQHLGPGQIDNISIVAPKADPDGDGRPNLVEYALNTLPETPNQDAIGSLSYINGHLRFRFVQPADRANVTYHAEWSSDLLTWNPINDIIVDSSGDIDIIEATPPTSSRIFCRLSISFLD
ncbi:MAG: hypothetical protein ABII82_06340 [Verrucomicrobiota bacterium]